MAVVCPIPTPSYHPLPSAEEIREIERDAIGHGITVKELMDRAGMECAAIIAERRKSSKPTDMIAVLCGSGNNGGDGLVIARCLVEKGFSVFTVIAAAKRYSDGCLLASRELIQAGAVVNIFPKLQDTQNYNWNPIDEAALVEQLKRCTVIVDAVFGTGATLPAKGFAARLIRLANEERQRHPQVFSVDLPSGVNPNSGEVTSPAIEADCTLSIQFPKRGLMQWPARQLCGELISIPIGLKCTIDCEYALLAAGAVRRIPRRPSDSHKGSYGHVMIIGGTALMPGAPILASLAALRCGAGLVTKLHLGYSGHNLPPEIMLIGPEKGLHLTSSMLPMIKERIESGRITSLVVGPGLGTDPDTCAAVIELLSFLGSKRLPFVLDADGINILAAELKRQDDGRKEFKLHCSVLTPHPLEMARLLNISVEEVNSDRYKAAKTLAKRLNCAVVLKGASSVVYFGSKGYVNSTGNPFMATGGAGDALSGIIAALMSQGFSPFEAACTGTYLHGSAGDYAHESSGSFIIASDIIAAIPRVARIIYD